MARYALAIDLNRCVNCKACNAACKMANDVSIGHFWNWVDRKSSDVLTTETGPLRMTFITCPCNASIARIHPA